MLKKLSQQQENKAIVISVNSTKALTVSNYNSVSKLVNKQKKLNDIVLPKIEESAKSAMKKD